jgi:NAD dependent epimerase/dehydratase
MQLKGCKTLVTGAGGFIGSHLVESLLAKGADVRALVKYNARGDLGMLSDLSPDNRNRLEVVSGDIRDPFFVRDIVKSCDVVFHLASLIGIPYSYVAPAEYVATNVMGTLNVLQACLDEKTQRLVHTSTSETYGTARYVPIDEEHPMQGQSPYSASKIGADKMAESYHKSFDLPVVTVRPFNTFGPRQSSRAFIPTAISQALVREKLVMGALNTIRDLTFVQDTVEGFIDVGLSDNVVGQTVNLGSGVGHSIGDVVNLILKILGREDMPIEQSSERIRPEKSEVQQLVSANQKALDLCGWAPAYSLEDGLVQTIDWMKENIGIYDPNRYSV